MLIQDSEAAAAFFWLHNLQRYLTPFDHVQPWWYYLPELAGGMLPWSLLLIPYFWKTCFRRAGSVGDRSYSCDHGIPPVANAPGSPIGFFVLALCWCLLFFSLSGCKRPGYILAAMPLLALILGSLLARGSFLGWAGLRGGTRLTWLAAAMLALLLPAVFWLLPAYHNRFAMRALVWNQNDRPLPVACYPRGWDSIPFYLERHDVRVYSAAIKDTLLANLQQQGETLLFVKTPFLKDFQATLPASLEFIPRGPRAGNVTAGVIVRRQ